MKDVAVNASVNEEGIHEYKENHEDKILILDELEMKFEWSGVRKMINRTVGSEEKDVQCIIPKHRRDVEGLKVVTPTPKTSYERYKDRYETLNIN